MKRLIAVFFVGWACALSGGCAPRSPLLGHSAPPLELELLDGTALDLGQHRGREVVLLDFWATWCGPCRMELPVLVEVAEQYRSRGVVLYAVNQGETPDQIRRFLDQANLAVTVALDTADAGGSVYGVEGIPTLVVIDRQGIVQAVRVGFSPSLKAELIEQLDALLAARG